MKNNNISDDKLISMVSQELAKLGLIVPMGELEASIVNSYDRIRDAHSLDTSTVTISSDKKDDVYYGTLFNVVCLDIISRYRLAQCTDGYMVTSYLSLLQKYLDNLALVANTERLQAPAVFEEILSKLPVNMTIQRGPDGGWITQVSREKGGKPIRNSIPTQPKINPKQSTGPTPKTRVYSIPLHSIMIPTSLFNDYMTQVRGTDNTNNAATPRQQNVERHICSSCDMTLCGDCTGCQSCNETECGPDLVISVNYQGECFGFRIDPGVVGLERASYTEEEWNECIGALKHAILKAGKVLSKRSGEMMTVFQKAFIREHSGEDD